jgi:P4 family phage/plasmid primase-like protien
MDLSIQKILREHKVKGVFHTHVSMGQTKGRYQFNRTDLEEFWKVYGKTIHESTGTSSNICIAEKPQHYLPILGDIDIKVRETDEVEVDDELHTEKHVKEVVEVYQSVLRKIVEDCTDQKLTCVLLEKPLYRILKNGVSYAKHGFHIHFPYCFLNKIDQEVHLIPRVQEMLTQLKTFEDLGFEDSGLMIDKACCKVPWLLYGSSKENGMDSYKVTKVFNSEGNEIELEEAFRKYKLYDIQEKLIKINGKVNEYLPRILSIVPYGRDVSELKNGLVSPLKEKIQERKKNDKEYKKESVSQEIALAKQLVAMLATFRATDRNEWMTIGWILYNVGEGCPEALDLWCEFSARCEDEYDEAVCIYQWERMTKKDLTLGTLRYYASVDSPEKYAEFKKEQGTKYIHESLNGSHNDIAKVLFAEYGNEFVCASAASKVWFQFVGHKWEQIEDGIFLRKKISGEIVDRYTVIGKEILTQLAACTDKGEEAMYNARLKQVQKMMGNLKSSPYKNNIMKECMEVFYDKRFREKLDTNPALFPFKNGIYDLVTNIFRPGRPEDFISTTSPIDYIEMNDDDERVHDIHDYLEKVFPDKSVRTYFTDIASDIFFGGNHQKHVYFLLGEGDNSKSVIQTLFEKMLGHLSIKFNTTVITGKKVQSGAANPELARAGGGVRLATLEEPNSDEMINIGILKNLSGNDSFYARDLFEKGKEGREIIPMFKLFFICNKLPKLKFSDKAVWNRIRVIPFESTFCRPDEPAPDTYEEQLRQKRFPMDKDFGRKIPDMVQAFAWVLLQHRLTIKDRVEPEKVKIATAVYRKENDIYRQFIEECITEDKDRKLSLTELYSAFKDWFRDSLPHHNLPIKNEVEEYFIRIWDEPDKGKKWKGYRIRTLQDDVNDGDAIILGDEDLINYDDEEGVKNLPSM